MRIGIDARELTGHPTGVGRYLGGLIREWTHAEARHGHEIVLYAPGPVAWSCGDSEVRILPGSGGTIWEQWTLSRALARDAVDVLFSPAYSTPLTTRVPRVVALHDISFAAHPEWFAVREGLRRRVLARRSAAAAHAIITISAFSKSEIVRLFGTSASRIHVVPPGIDVPVPPSDAPKRPSASVLYVGSIFVRRHIPDLIAAFTQLAARHEDATLQLVGDNRSHPQQDIGALIESSPVSSRIHWHRYVPEPQLQALYADARACAFLSEYEGLGLTPLEGLAAGIPPVLLDTPVAREACGPAALYVPAGNIDAVARALETLLYNEEARRGLLAAAPDALARFDWARAADATLAVIEGAA
jgi:glycosyltransferase involved in cell wall biosynthesis